MSKWSPVLKRGSKHGHWTVVRTAVIGAERVPCVCVCGTRRIVRVESLRKGASKSCGCRGKAGASKVVSPSGRGVGYAVPKAGTKIGKLTVIGPAANRSHYKTAEVLCDCGRSFVMRVCDLIGDAATTRKCRPCSNRDNPRSLATQHLQRKPCKTGAVYGGWVVLGPAPSDRYGKSMAYARCACGFESIVRCQDLRDGRRLSCGCGMRASAPEAVTDPKVTVSLADALHMPIGTGLVAWRDMASLRVKAGDEGELVGAKVVRSLSGTRVMVDVAWSNGRVVTVPAEMLALADQPDPGVNE